MATTPRDPAAAPAAGQAAGPTSAPLYHVAEVSAFHFDANTVTLLFAATLPGAAGPASRDELGLNLGHADFERMLRRLVEIRAALAEAGALAPAQPAPGTRRTRMQ